MADLSPEDQDFLREAIKQVLDEGKTPEPIQAPPAKLKMNIAGQEYEFENAEDAGRKMTEFVHRASQMTQAPPPAAKPTATVSGNDAPEFNMDVYAEYMQNGKVTDGLDYWLKSNVGAGVQDLKAKLAKVDELNNTLAVYQFRDRHPELSKLDPTAGQAIEHVRKSLNLPFNAEGLDAAYFYARDRGFIKAPVQETVPVPVPAEKTPNMLAPAPHISRSGDANQGLSMDDMENMSIEQLEKTIGLLARGR